MNDAKHSLEVLILIAGLVITIAVIIPVVTLTGILSDDTNFKPAVTTFNQNLDTHFSAEGRLKHTCIEMMKSKFQTGMKMRNFTRESLHQDPDGFAKRVKKRVQALNSKHIEDRDKTNSRFQDNLKNDRLTSTALQDRLQGLVAKGIITQEMVDSILSHFQQLNSR